MLLFVVKVVTLTRAERTNFAYGNNKSDKDVDVIAVADVREVEVEVGAKHPTQ